MPGTSPRSARRDALVAAVDIVHALQAAMWDRDDVVRFTIGMFNVSPNVPSVVPARVVFSLDLRHPDANTLQNLGDAIPDICRRAAGRCEVAVTTLLHDPPLEFPAAIRRRLASIASDLAIPHMEIASGAGHDARYLHYFCPSGMIFIPCKDGISHNEAKSVLPDHVTAGARVLAEAVFVLADCGDPYPIPHLCLDLANHELGGVRPRSGRNPPNERAANGSTHGARHRPRVASRGALHKAGRPYRPVVRILDGIRPVLR